MNKIVSYIKSSFEEVRYKVTWPKYTELQSSTLLVIVATVIFALVIFLIDAGFKNGLSFIY